MLLRAMFSGVSGLRAEGEAIGVAGDNIANVNTVGFKGQRAVFQDVLGRPISSGSSAAPGAGVRVGSVQQMFTQGSLSNTGVATDVALNGDGFLVVSGTVDGMTSDFYSRAGQMTIAADGRIVNLQGLSVQGYRADPLRGTLAAEPSGLQVPTASLAPRPTDLIAITANLDSGDPLITAFPAFDPAEASRSANYSTSIEVFDSLGNARSLNVFFRKSATANEYDYHVVTDAENVGGAAGAPPVELTSGTLSFTAAGALNAVTGANPFAVNFTDAVPGQQLTLDFGTPIAEGGTGLEGTTQFASSSAVSSQSQNGYSSGEFTGVAIDGTGLVQGLYTNGQKIAIGQLAIAKFRSNDGLGRAGQNLWIETRESGAAAIGAAGAGGRAAVTSGALEGSNVDLAEEFVGLIQHQRSFSANSRTITTADEMLQELISIKR